MRFGFPLVADFPDSSAIERAAYNPGTQSLDIWYEGGNQYSYYGVPPHTYQQLLKADSAGEFVNRQIKPFFRYKRRTDRRSLSRRLSARPGADGRRPPGSPRSTR